MDHSREENSGLGLRLSKMSLGNLQAYYIIHQIGEKVSIEFEQEVSRFLSSPEPQLRKVALNVLVNHWGLQKYGDLCKELLRSDPSNDVRDAAASCLGTLYEDTENTEVISLLRDSLVDQDEHWTVRQVSYDSILRILGVPMSRRPAMTQRMDFDQDIDWNLIGKV